MIDELELLQCTNTIESIIRVLQPKLVSCILPKNTKFYLFISYHNCVAITKMYSNSKSTFFLHEIPTLEFTRGHYILHDFHTLSYTFGIFCYLETFIVEKLVAKNKTFLLESYT